MPGRGRGRPPLGASGTVITTEYSDAYSAAPLLADRTPLSQIERREFDFTDLDNWMRQADQAIRRTKVVLDQLAAPGGSTPARSDRA
jgi:hypothetical protein